MFRASHMAEKMSKVIHEIDECLDLAERKKLLYLSGAENISTDRPITHALGCRTDIGNMRMFLMELLLKMKRLDILKTTFGIAGEDVGQTLGTGPLISDYRMLMVDLSDNIGSEDLHSIGFLLSDLLSSEVLDSVESFLDIIISLEKHGEVSSDRLDILSKCLRDVHRIDLVKKINHYNLKRKRTCTLKAIDPLPLKTSPHVAGCKVNLMIPKDEWRPPTKHKKPQTSVTTRCERTGPEIFIHEYRMEAAPRGLCLIIDCVGNDGDQLQETFSHLHFRVILRKLLNLSDCLSTLYEIAQLPDHHSADVFACCIISRCADNALLGTEPSGPGLSLGTVRSIFEPRSSPGLAGKPKLFFVQSYSASQEHHMPQRQWSGGNYYLNENLETDGLAFAAGMSSVPTSADVLWSHCFTGDTALEEPNHRSLYLQALQSSILNGQERRTHLLDVHMEVNRRIFEYNDRMQNADYNSSSQVRAYKLDLRHTLRKMLYLA